MVLIIVLVLHQNCTRILINSCRGINLLKLWFKCSHTVTYIRTLLALIFDCIFDLCCRLLIRITLLIYSTCTYNRFHRFRTHFIVCRYMLLTNPCHLLIHAARNSWNVNHGMCLVVTRKSLPLLFLEKSRICKINIMHLKLQ